MESAGKILIQGATVMDVVADLFIEANCRIQEEVFDAWFAALEREDEPRARNLIQAMIKNAWLAWERNMPICQDTGQAVVIVEQGEWVEIIGMPLFDAINQGVEKGGREGFLRKSVVLDPLDRNNAGSYGPAVIHHRIVPGDRLKITMYPAGCGCEQMNRTSMFPPCDEEKTIEEFVLNRMIEAGSKPCPPNILGIGIGGDLEQAGYLARMALLRPLGERSLRYGGLEQRLMKKINQLHTGPHGLGGNTTVIAVNIEGASCHRANLPIAIAFNCHIGRRSQRVLGGETDRAGFDKKGAFEERLRQAAEGIGLFKDALKVQLPLSGYDIKRLKMGDEVLLTGPVYTARDAAHRRLIGLIQDKAPLPFHIEGQTIYYVGPTPPRSGEVIGSAGPTTSARMDAYTPILLSKGLKGMIGKGSRNPEVIEAIKRYSAIYFFTFAGAGALLAQHIIKSEVIAFEELGTEAIRRLEIRDFPAIVACDAGGNDIYARHSI